MGGGEENFSPDASEQGQDAKRPKEIISGGQQWIEKPN